MCIFSTVEMKDEVSSKCEDISCSGVNLMDLWEFEIAKSRRTESRDRISINT